MVTQASIWCRSRMRHLRLRIQARSSTTPGRLGIRIPENPSFGILSERWRNVLLPLADWSPAVSPSKLYNVLFVNSQDPFLARGGLDASHKNIIALPVEPQNCIFAQRSIAKISSDSDTWRKQPNPSPSSPAITKFAKSPAPLYP